MNRIDIDKTFIQLFAIDSNSLYKKIKENREKKRKTFGRSYWNQWKSKGMPEKYFTELMIAVREIIGESASILSNNDSLTVKMFYKNRTKKKEQREFE